MTEGKKRKVQYIFTAHWDPPFWDFNPKETYRNILGFMELQSSTLARIYCSEIKVDIYFLDVP